MKIWKLNYAHLPIRNCKSLLFHLHFNLNLHNLSSFDWRFLFSLEIQGGVGGGRGVQSVGGGVMFLVPLRRKFSVFCVRCVNIRREARRVKFFFFFLSWSFFFEGGGVHGIHLDSSLSHSLFLSPIFLFFLFPFYSLSLSVSPFCLFFLFASFSLTLSFFLSFVLSFALSRFYLSFLSVFLLASFPLILSFSLSLSLSLSLSPFYLFFRSFCLPLSL